MPLSYCTQRFATFLKIDYYANLDRNAQVTTQMQLLSISSLPIQILESSVLDPEVSELSGSAIICTDPDLDLDPDTSINKQIH
jgi:hypothetical protein